MFCLEKRSQKGKVEGEQKKYTDVFKSGGNILGQSASER